MSATPQQVRQWSEEVARDPGSLAFLPLAEAYREGGRRDAAQRLCIRGLERHPTHVEAHVLLGIIYEEAGDLTRAFDEWDIALHLAPEHGDARRRIGLLSARRGEWAAAVRHLERAVNGGATDPEVVAALAEARTRAGSVPGASAPTAVASKAAPASVDAAPATVAASAPAALEVTSTPTDVPVTAPPSTDAAQPAAWEVLQAEFRALGAERGIAGVVLLDDHGYVLAGEMLVEGVDRAQDVAATLSGASTEAERAVRHLEMGAWRGILLETPAATVRLVPLSDGGMLAVAARREVPTGWVLRVAGRAQEAAERYLGGGGGAA